jgi:tryprostatin B 6-hydroxylase
MLTFKAFTTKALRSYDGRLIKYTDQLIDQLRRRSGQVVNAREWVHYFAFGG